jgi:hypothetical protein
MSSLELDQLRAEMRKFLQWASRDADRRNTDWPTDYPAYCTLVAAAGAAMRSLCDTAHVSREDIELLCDAWELTEEPENLREEALAIGERAGWLLTRLYDAGRVDVRWQIASLGGKVSTLGAVFLERAIQDPDPYVRRRAWIAFHEFDPRGAAVLAGRAIGVETDVDVRGLLTEISRGVDL